MLVNEIHINDLFFTLQGEGANWGRRSLFIRMPFCNLACEWCDTTFNTFTKYSVEQFKEFALKEETRFAVITGGEPMMHKHTPSVALLLSSLGYEVACETNGMFPIVPNIDFVTCSPKRQSAYVKSVISPYYIDPSIVPKVNEWKYVVDDLFNFEILKRHDNNPSVRYSLSPEFGDFKVNVDKIISYIKENPKWRLSLQTHKILGLP